MGFTVLDDVNDVTRLNAVDRLLLFDYRATEYLDHCDAVFFLDIPEDLRLARLSGDAARCDDYNSFLQSPPMTNSFLSFFRITVD